jgi:hypothetical protein
VVFLRNFDTTRALDGIGRNILPTLGVEYAHIPRALSYSSMLRMYFFASTVALSAYFSEGCTSIGVKDRMEVYKP